MRWNISLDSSCLPACCPFALPVRKKQELAIFPFDVNFGKEFATEVGKNSKRENSTQHRAELREKAQSTQHAQLRLTLRSENKCLAIIQERRLAKSKNFDNLHYNYDTI